MLCYVINFIYLFNFNFNRTGISSVEIPIAQTLLCVI